MNYTFVNIKHILVLNKYTKIYIINRNVSILCGYMSIYPDVY